MNRFPRILLAAGLTLSCLGTGPAAADWIVTTDGERIETRGAWEVKGRLVVMTLADGELASMRLSEVDLEASRRATEEAGKASEAPPDEDEAETPVRQRSKIVLTDDDFTTVRRLPRVSDDEAGASDEGSAASASALTVLTSEEARDPETGGTVVSGILANRSQNALANVSLIVRLHDVEGEVLEEVEAALSSPSLSPGGRASFRALFPNVLAFARVEFEPRSVELVTEGSESPESSDVEGGQGR